MPPVERSDAKPISKPVPKLVKKYGDKPIQPPAEDWAEVPPPDGSLLYGNNRDSRDSRDSRVLRGRRELEDLETFLTRYMVMPPVSALVVSSWVMASYATERWDRFPHLAVTSPEKRCGKTVLLKLLEMVGAGSESSTNISPASIYRLIELRREAGEAITLLIDEAQSLSRKGSESAQVINELLCAGIDRNSKVLRVGGAKNDQVLKFSVYCPKVVAMIGKPDGVLADRCLPTPLRRKTEADKASPLRERTALKEVGDLRDRLAGWATSRGEQLGKVYDGLDTFKITNDRMAELLLPLMSVLTLVAPDRLSDLHRFAEYTEQVGKQEDAMSDGVRLLTACREIMATVKPTPDDGVFIPSRVLIERLVNREEEPWATFSCGKPITPEKLSSMLVAYSIKSKKNKKQVGGRGYYAVHFKDAWTRYLPTPARTPGEPG